jgi:hypothetical protein
MKKMRETREQQLIRWGFLPFEAQELRIIKNPPPYFKQLIMQRRSMRMNAKKYGWSEAEFSRRVKSVYEKERIAKRILGRKETRYSPWDLLRKYEDRYKDRHPNYETPTAKKPSSTRDFNYGALKPRKRKQKWYGKPYG